MSEQLIIAIITIIGGIFASFSSGLTGFGSGIVFQTWWALCENIGIPAIGDLETSLAIVHVIATTNSLQFSPAVLKNGGCRHDLLYALLPGTIGMSWLGSWAVASLSQDILKKTLGLIFLLFALYQLYQRFQIILADRKSKRELSNATLLPLEPVVPQVSSQVVPILTAPELLNADNEEDATIDLGVTSDSMEELEKQSYSESDSAGDRVVTPTTSVVQVKPMEQITPEVTSFMIQFHEWKRDWKNNTIEWAQSPLTIAAFFVGMVGGFLNGAFGTGGPPIILFFSVITISKAEIRGTFMVYSLILAPIKIISGVVFGIYKSEQWLAYLVAIPSSLIGAHLGDLLHKRVNQNTVMMMLQGLVLLSTVPLTGAGNGTPFGWMMIFAYIGIVIVCTLAIASLIYEDWKQKTKQLTMNPYQSTPIETGNAALIVDSNAFVMEEDNANDLNLTSNSLPDLDYESDLMQTQ